MITASDAGWNPLKTWLLERIEERRRALEQGGRTTADYDIDRGVIQAYRGIIETVQPEKQFERPRTPGYNQQ